LPSRVGVGSRRRGPIPQPSQAVEILGEFHSNIPTATTACQTPEAKWIEIHA
jgi:hypothetical protein